MHTTVSYDERQPVDAVSGQAGPAISVIVYARNDAETIPACLESLAAQDFKGEFEVLVVDDGSSDGTTEIIHTGFPQFALVRWVALVRKALAMARGQTLAFLGSHCRAEGRWVRAVETEMSGERKVITGRGTHGDGRFLARFEALSVHSDYLGSREGERAFLWDDNFAIRSTVLKRALPHADRCVSDGAGAVLLSLELRRLGIPIHYRPALEIDHATHPLGTIISYWYGEMAENAIAIKLEEPSLPGARLLWLGPVAALALAAARLTHGVRASLRSRHDLSISLLEVGAHACLYAGLTLAYFLGLCREIGRNWERIRQQGAQAADEVA